MPNLMVALVHHFRVDTLSYLFKFCVEANVKTTVRDDAYKKSLDDRLIDYRTGVDLDGYVWGVCW